MRLILIGLAAVSIGFVVFRFGPWVADPDRALVEALSGPRGEFVIGPGAKLSPRLSFAQFETFVLTDVSAQAVVMNFGPERPNPHADYGFFIGPQLMGLYREEALAGHDVDVVPPLWIGTESANCDQRGETDFEHIGRDTANAVASGFFVCLDPANPAYFGVVAIDRGDRFQIVMIVGRSSAVEPGHELRRAVMAGMARAAGTPTLP